MICHSVEVEANLDRVVIWSVLWDSWVTCPSTLHGLLPLRHVSCLHALTTCIPCPAAPALLRSNQPMTCTKDS